MIYYSKEGAHVIAELTDHHLYYLLAHIHTYHHLHYSHTHTHTHTHIYISLLQGAMNRATAATGMNEGSSRSHSVFTVTGKLSYFMSSFIRISSTRDIIILSITVILYSFILPITLIEHLSNQSTTTFLIPVNQKDTRSGIVKSGKLVLVDLAGSEMVNTAI